MDYPLENLGPERFQQLCQSLLVLSEPNMSCYPVGMPDGGRDASRSLLDNEEKSFYVYQVKFSRDLKKGKEGREWLLNAADGEIEKAKRLKSRGATRYIIITNVEGSSHLDSGSMDVVRSELTARFEMPVECWWRDDICRRLDGNWSIKLRYPEVLNGQDFLRLLIEQQGSGEHSRRINAIKAFLADQYKEDCEVKFKQVELQNKLLDLFVDLPFSVHIGQKQLIVKKKPEIRVDPRLRLEEKGKGSLILKAAKDVEDLGTASLLLNELADDLLNQVVIEGAPGQGKSTLTQYLCQVHRIRILGKAEDLSLLPENHRTAPVYLPFKVDLRDLAEWLAGSDPFSSAAPQGESTERTVEAFLARLVAHKAGGFAFSVNDLVEVSKLSPLFIAFDGLDEVADIKRRSDVVSGVTKTLSRLRENCPNMRAIITSRPAAFANSPGFDQDDFPHIQLGSVTKLQINAYASKWLDARALGSSERQEFERILEEKLSQPHLKDLSKNPMQLTILLSLILTKGAALPDKRTALYDAYIELFFGRESSKNPIVRANLDLLKDIHRYLAWILHSRAEASKGARTDGRLTTEEMKSVLQNYLKQEGQSTEIINEIFSAMLERIVMIVSRIEGTHEFEVQPLREYFAARYLYDTASYSPPGEEKSGTKPDRFDAIARNPFWLNVTRFYCGCFSKGELLDLADRVKTLLKDNVLGRTRRPATLAGMLLQDLVFLQSPKAITELTDTLGEKANFRKLLPTDNGYRMEDNFRLHPNSGGHDLSKRAMSYLLADDAKRGLSERLCRFVNANPPSTSIAETWLQAIPKGEKGYLQWLRVGYHLNLLDVASYENIVEIVKGRQFDNAVVELFWNSRQGFNFAETSERNAEICIEHILSSPIIWPDDEVANPCYLLPVFQEIGRHEGMHGGAAEFQIKLLAVCDDFTKSASFSTSINSRLFELSKNCFNASREIAGALQADPSLSESYAPLGLLVEVCNKHFGEAPFVIDMGIIVCEQVTKRGRVKKANLFDRSEPLLERLRYAKTQARSVKWVVESAKTVKTEEDRILWLAIVWMWAASSVIAAECELISRLIEELSDRGWRKFASSNVRSYFRSAPSGKPIPILPFTTKSRKFAFLFAQCEPQKYGHAVFLSHFKSTEKVPLHMAEPYFRAYHVTLAAANGDLPWEECSRLMKSIENDAFRTYAHPRLPHELIEDIVEHPDEYPIVMWDRAQNVLFTNLSREIKPVAVVAKKEKWFV